MIHHIVVFTLLIPVFAVSAMGLEGSNDLASIIPRATQSTAAPGHFRFTEQTVVQVGMEHALIGQQLAEMLAPATGLQLKVVPAGAEANAVRIEISPSASDLGDEGYRLKIDADRVVITSASEAGAFYAIQSVRQLLPPKAFGSVRVKDLDWSIPCGTIEDRPRFGYRGMMLDCSRHFMPKAFVLRFIDLLAVHKMNGFHWHLTDDQGWRLEIKKYPLLTEIGGRRSETLVGHGESNPRKFDGTPHGGFYTQDEVREVVAYATARHITVVPEIEMPGHARAAIAAYPQLGNSVERLGVKTDWGVEPHILNVDEPTILFFQDVLAEVIELFPSKLIHIGGDEAVKGEWEQSPAVHARMQSLGIKTTHDMQAYFINRMAVYLAARGRRLLGWDEILQGGLSPNAVVMSWHSEAGAVEAARHGHDAVLAPTGFTYFDHYQSKQTDQEPLAIGGFLPLRLVYQFDPLPKQLTSDQARHILGAQAQLWSEYIPTTDQVEYMAYPRACALAEVLWSGNADKDYQGFLLRLRTHLLRLDEMHVHYRMPEELGSKSTGN